MTSLNLRYQFYAQSSAQGYIANCFKCKEPGVGRVLCARLWALRKDPLIFSLTFVKTGLSRGLQTPAGIQFAECIISRIRYFWLLSSRCV